MCRIDNRGAHPSPLTWRLLDGLRGAGPAGTTQDELLAAWPPAERPTAALGLGWLLKTGLIELA